MLNLCGKPQELISDFSKITGYKINIQKKVFLYLNEHMGIGINIKNTVLFIITQKMKYLGVNQTKHIQDLCKENCTMVMKN